MLLTSQTVDENLKVSAERLVDQVSLTRHRSCSLSPDLVNAANGAKFQKERGAMDDKLSSYDLSLPEKLCRNR